MRWERRLNGWEERRFDRKLGVDTGGRLEPLELTVPSGDASAGITYLGTQPRLARWWLSALPPDHGRFTFVDMGSGKGRVLLFAVQVGFSRSVGVEFAEELHSTAVANAEAARGHGFSIEPVLGDAASFEFPLGPLVVHFNNPFSEKTMERVLANLSASYERESRPLVVVYQQMRDEQPRASNAEPRAPRSRAVSQRANSLAPARRRRPTDGEALHGTDLRVSRGWNPHGGLALSTEDPSRVLRTRGGA